MSSNLDMHMRADQVMEQIAFAKSDLKDSLLNLLMYTEKDVTIPGEVGQKVIDDFLEITALQTASHGA